MMNSEESKLPTFNDYSEYHSHTRQIGPDDVGKTIKCVRASFVAFEIDTTWLNGFYMVMRVPGDGSIVVRNMAINYWHELVVPARYNKSNWVVTDELPRGVSYEIGCTSEDNDFKSTVLGTLEEPYCETCMRQNVAPMCKCKRVRYCSERCQRADWKHHKKYCSHKKATNKITNRLAKMSLKN